MRPLFVALAFSICLVTAASTAAAEEPRAVAPTEREWLINLVDTLNLSFGLPEQPQDGDYIRLLDGHNHFRIEAEEKRSASDLVGINTFTSYGPFSGTGWVSGLATPTKLHLDFLLPRSGNYLITAAIRIGGLHMLLSDQPLITPTFADQKFHVVSLGVVALTAGQQNLVIDLPPNSGIDYIDINAADTVPISPRDGWHTERALSYDALAVTAARLLALEPLLPLDGTVTVYEVDALTTVPADALTDQQHLGLPSGSRWLRAGASPLPLTLAFSPPQAAVYDLMLRAAVDGRLTGRLNGRLVVSAQYPIFLVEKSLGTYYLDGTLQQLTFTLQPRTGVDTLSLRRHRSSADDYRRLLGIAGTTDAPPDATTINRLLALVARLTPPVNGP